MTGMPHRPSSTDGHPPVSLLILSSSSFNRIRLSQEGARRYASPLPGYATARTVRRLV